MTIPKISIFLPSISTRKIKYILFIQIKQRHASLTDVVDADRKSEKFRFGPYVTTKWYSFCFMFSIKGRYGWMVWHLFSNKAQVIWWSPWARAIRHCFLCFFLIREIPIASKNKHEKSWEFSENYSFLSLIIK